MRILLSTENIQSQLPLLSPHLIDKYPFRAEKAVQGPPWALHPLSAIAGVGEKESAKDAKLPARLRQAGGEALLREAEGLL